MERMTYRDSTGTIYLYEKDTERIIERFAKYEDLLTNPTPELVEKFKPDILVLIDKVIQSWEERN